MPHPESIERNGPEPEEDRRIDEGQLAALILDLRDMANRVDRVPWGTLDGVVGMRDAAAVRMVCREAANLLANFAEHNPKAVV